MKNYRNDETESMYLERLSKTQKLLQLLNEELESISLNVSRLQEANTIEKIKKAESNLIGQVQFRIGILNMLGGSVSNLLDDQADDYLDDIESYEDD